jgi:hypothetical protein
MGSRLCRHTWDWKHYLGFILAGTSIALGAQSEVHGCALALSVISVGSSGAVYIPSNAPTASPSKSAEPSGSPSSSPSLSPQPSGSPSNEPSASAQPSGIPSSSPTKRAEPSCMRIRSQGRLDALPGRRCMHLGDWRRRKSGSLRGRIMRRSSRGLW